MALLASYCPATKGTIKKYKIHNICIEEASKCKSFTMLVSQDQDTSKLRLLRIYMHPKNKSWQAIRSCIGNANPPDSKHVAAADILAKQMMLTGGISITETSTKQNGKSVFSITSASLYDVDTDPIAFEASPTPLGKLYKGYLAAAPQAKPQAPQESSEELPPEIKKRRDLILECLEKLDNSCTYSGGNTIALIAESVRLGHLIDEALIEDLKDSAIDQRITSPDHMGQRLKGSLERYIETVCASVIF